MIGNHLRDVATWLDDLAVLCPGTLSLEEARARAAGMASLIASDYPAGCFNRDSLRHVGQTFRFFPGYAELHASLGAWWDQRKPQRPALPGETGQTLSAGDRVAIEQWLEGRRDPEVTAGTHLSMIKKYFPAAFGYLVNNHQDAHRLAWRRRLINRDEHP